MELFKVSRRRLCIDVRMNTISIDGNLPEEVKEKLEELGVGVGEEVNIPCG